MERSRFAASCPDPRTRKYLSAPEFSPPRILLAEDDPELRALIAGDLRAAGYIVVECPDGPALLARIEAAPRAEGLGADLVVSDVVMPGVTGLEVLERLRAADPFTPFIVLTAFGSPELRAAAIRLGALAVLDKPFESIRLLRLVTDTVGPGRPLR